MFDRIKKTWKALTRKCPEVPDKIYVYPSEYNRNKFVHLLSWRDTIIALDSEGKIWELRPELGPYSGFVCQYIQDSPRSY